MIAAIDAVRVRGDSVGGVVTCIVRNAPRVSNLCLFVLFTHFLYLCLNFLIF